MKKYLLLLSLGIATITTDSSAMFKNFIKKIKDNSSTTKNFIKINPLQDKKDNINLLLLHRNIAYLQQYLSNKRGAIYVEYNDLTSDNEFTSNDKSVRAKVKHLINCKEIGLSNINSCINDLDHLLNSEYSLSLPSFFDTKEILESIKDLKLTLQDSKNNIVTFERIKDGLTDEQLEQKAQLLTDQLKINNNRFYNNLCMIDMHFWSQIKKNQQNNE